MQVSPKRIQDVNISNFLVNVNILNLFKKIRTCFQILGLSGSYI